MSLNEQVYLSAHAIIYGFFMATCFDMMRISLASRKSTVTLHVVQAFFWLLQVPLLIVYMYRVNGGIFHFYVVIFLLLGAAIYFKFFRHLFFTHLSALDAHTKKVVKLIENIANKLFFKPMRFIFRTISDIMGLLKKIGLKVFGKIRRKKPTHEEK